MIEKVTINLEKLVDTAPIVKITWIDAQASSSWEKPKVDLAKCISVGFLVSEDEEGICLAGTISDDMCNNSISIPKKWIIQEEIAKPYEATKRQSKRTKSAKVGTRRSTKKVSAVRSRRR